MIVGDVVRLKSGGPWMTVSAVNADQRVTCTWFLPIGLSAPDVVLYASSTGSAMFSEAALETREPDPSAMRLRAMTVNGADRYWRDLHPRPGERIKQYVVDLRKEREWALGTCPRIEVAEHADNSGATCRNVGSARWIDLDVDGCSTCSNLCNSQRYRSDIAVWRVQADERFGETSDRTALSDEVAGDPLVTLDGYPVGRSEVRTSQA